MGETLAVHLGHTNVVSFVYYNPVVARALLSSSFDGTCRIWMAGDASVEPLVLKASPLFGPARQVRIGATVVQGPMSLL